MADGKWIAGLRADLPADEAARLVLRARLNVVREYLPRALTHPDDTEHVHQLRVGTRRADAALRLFASCLPAKTLGIARKRLRKLRRTAGEARDWDVFALALMSRRQRCQTTHRPGLDQLLGYALGKRVVAQTGLVKTGRKEIGRIETLVAGTLADVHLSSSVPTLIDLARTMLQPLRDELHAAATGDLDDYARLHRVRIAGKRLRYGMEVFADCFAPPFRFRLYPRVEEMQETLGRINDSHVAIGRLTEIRNGIQSLWPTEWERLRPGIEGLLRFHQRRQPQDRKEFLRWLESWRSEGEASFTELLAGSALPPQTPTPA